METLADLNRAVCDTFLDAETEPIEWTVTGLNTRRIYCDDRETLARVMDRFTGSFSFEATELFIENGFGFEITVPRIIIDID